MNRRFQIRLSDIRMHAFHGVMEQERKVGNIFKINVAVGLPAGDIGLDDNIEGTISYADLYSIVEGEMKETSQLLENVARRIADKISLQWPETDQITVLIEKETPPIAGIDGHASVCYFFEK